MRCSYHKGNTFELVTELEPKTAARTSWRSKVGVGGGPALRGVESNRKSSTNGNVNTERIERMEKFLESLNWRQKELKARILIGML